MDPRDSIEGKARRCTRQPVRCRFSLPFRQRMQLKQSIVLFALVLGACRTGEVLPSTPRRAPVPAEPAVTAESAVEAAGVPAARVSDEAAAVPDLPAPAVLAREFRA